MKSARAWMLAAVVATACGGGRGGDREPPGLVTATTTAPRPIDVDAAARDGGELARALAQPWRVAAAALGDHRLTIDSTVIVKDGATELEQLGEHVVIESAAAGPYHATADNTADYGREVIWVGGRLYLRPRYALWHERGPETDDEPAAIRDQIAEVLGDYLDLCARGLEVSDKGAAQAAGRSGRRVELKLAPAPRAVPPQPVVQRAWRDTVVVTALGGEVILDDELGVALTGSLTAEVQFQRAGKALTMAVTVTHAVATIAAPTVAPPAPDQVVATPTRAREVDDRNALLKGIAPPQGKAAVEEPAVEPTPAPAEPTAPTKGAP
ncbi:MAG: hypothetical protein IPL61_37735 [Myxococcales bacterium]|nr:hypothetical protein [Myxococcales bacterium]